MGIMSTESFIQQNKVHMIIVVAIILTQYFAKDISALSYRHYSRPTLLKEGGYRSCADYQPIIQEYRPDNCDLVRVTKTGDYIEELYYAGDGSQKVKVISANGCWVRTGTEYTSNRTSTWLPFSAFFVFMVSILHKIARTGKFWTWSLAAEPNDRFETVLRLYAMPVFICSIIFGWLKRY
jgi:hypothetical protein